MSINPPSELRKFITSLCVGKTEQELEEAEQRFRDYLLLAKEICDRYAREGKKLPSFDKQSE